MLQSGRILLLRARRHRPEHPRHLREKRQAPVRPTSERKPPHEGLSLREKDNFLAGPPAVLARADEEEQRHQEPEQSAVDVLQGGASGHLEFRRLRQKQEQAAGQKRVEAFQRGCIQGEESEEVREEVAQVL